MISSKRSSSSPSPCSLLLLALFLLLITTVVAQESPPPSWPPPPCSNRFRELTLKKNLANCKKLSTLGAEFGWNYRHHHQSGLNGTAHIEFLFGVRAQKTLKWIAWGVNPKPGPQMVGTRAVIGIIKEVNGGKVVNVKTYNVTGYTKLGCPFLPSAVEFPTWNLTGEVVSGDFAMIYARIELDSRVYNVSRLNHVWQVGFSADTGALEPRMHGLALQNFDSLETMDLVSGRSHGYGHHRAHLRMVHGILNIIGWGTLLPVGVIIARYFKNHPIELKKWWFYLHVTCQIIGYILGTAGWAIGISLGNSSPHYTFRLHRLLAIFIFTFTTLQMLALRLRPKDHDEYRKYWDMYHHFLGYGLLTLIGFNIFQGIAIMKSHNSYYSWKWAYIGILGLLSCVTLGFEIYTWIKFLGDLKKNKNDNNQTKINNDNDNKKKTKDDNNKTKNNDDDNNNKIKDDNN